MSEILFRGKRLDNGEWVYGYYCEAEMFDHTGTEYFIIERSCDGTQYHVDPETVGQFTNITDSKGKRICEGDIVSIYSKLDEKECLGHVEFSERGFWAFVPVNGNDFFYESANLAGFDTSLDLYCLVYSIDYDNAKVIGNIHDNPELFGMEASQT